MTIWCDIDSCRNDAAWRLVSYPDNVLLCAEHLRVVSIEASEDQGVLL